MSTTASRSSSITQGNYPYYQDAVRICVQKKLGEDGLSSADEAPSELSHSRRFSVDPQLTDFNILRNLVGRAFEMKGDFEITYRALDDYGGETYLPLVSDWDLNAAFASASDPDLKLVIQPKSSNADLDLDNEDEPWDVARSAEIMRGEGIFPNDNLKSPASIGVTNNSSNFQSDNACRNSANNNVSGGSKMLSAMSQIGGAVNQYPIALNSKINTTGLFNTMEKWVQKAKTFVEDLSVVTTRPPLSDVEFRNYLDAGGVLCRPRELRYACYHGGIEPGLRKVVWKHLLNIYPDGLSGNARMDYVRKKSKEYLELRSEWTSAVLHDKVGEHIRCVSNMVRKDVLRTDRHLQFFAGHEDNQNVTILYHVLTTYALNHPSVGYCQGMSDLASPLLVTMGDEAQAYICFCALMDRLKPNFSSDGESMSLKFNHLSDLLAHYDLEFWNYLNNFGGDDLLFCYRWLLLELKREFAFEDALRMMEVLWASLPYKPQDVPLYEVKFNSKDVHSIKPPTSHASSFNTLCALRRSASNCSSPTTSNLSKDIRNRRYSRKPKGNPLSLDENSIPAMSSSGSYTRSHTKPFYSLDETFEAAADMLVSGSSPIELLNLGTPPSRPKLIKNLREFWAIGKAKLNSDESEKSDRSSFSATSSKSSTASNLEGEEALLEPDNSSQVFYDSPNPDSQKSQSNSNSLPETQRQGNVGHEENLVRKSEGRGGNTEQNMERGDGDICSRTSGSSAGSPFLDPHFRSGSEKLTEKTLPGPEGLGGGNPFLMFLCLTLLLQHKDHIIRNCLDYNETAMYFDKLIRKHNVVRVLSQARVLYSEYLKQNVARA